MLPTSNIPIIKKKHEKNEEIDTIQYEDNFQPLKNKEDILAKTSEPNFSVKSDEYEKSCKYVSSQL